MKSLRDFYFMRAAARRLFWRENRLYRQTEAPDLPVPSFYYSAFFVSSSSSFASMPNSFASASRLDVLGSDAPVSLN